MMAADEKMGFFFGGGLVVVFRFLLWFLFIFSSNEGLGCPLKSFRVGSIALRSWIKN